MHARADQIIAEAAQYTGANPSVGIERRDQIGKDAVEVGHARASPVAEKHEPLLIRKNVVAQNT